LQPRRNGDCRSLERWEVPKDTKLKGGKGKNGQYRYPAADGKTLINKQKILTQQTEGKKKHVTKKSEGTVKWQKQRSEQGKRIFGRAKERKCIRKKKKKPASLLSEGKKNSRTDVRRRMLSIPRRFELDWGARYLHKGEVVAGGERI